jgi:hypothetical protein
MRRGPRSHNSRVDSERRGSGALNLSAPFHFAAQEKRGEEKRERRRKRGDSHQCPPRGILNQARDFLTGTPVAVPSFSSFSSPLFLILSFFFSFLFFSFLGFSALFLKKLRL